jgi:preprotein translocase subunit YajC
MPTLLLSTLIAAKKSSSSSPVTLIIIVVLFVAVYFFFLRPRSKRMRSQQQTVSNLSVGDEVISAGGILGTITAIAGDEISVEVAPGYTLTFWRRAINLRTAVKGAPQSTHIAEDDSEYEDETGAPVYESETGYEDEAVYDEDVETEEEADEPEEGAADEETEDEAADGDDGHEDDQGGPTGGSSGVR